MRCDPKPVAWGEPFAGGEVGVAERIFGDNLTAMRDSDDAARLLRAPQLKFDPVADVSDGGLHPRFHLRHLPKMSDRLQQPRTRRKIQQNVLGGYRTKQSRRNPRGLRRLNWHQPYSVN